MSAAPEMPIPPEVFADAPPLSDDDLNRYFDAIDHVVERDSVDQDDAETWIAEGGEPSFRVAAHVAGWHIEDDGSAAWAAAKYAGATGEMRRLTEQADEWAERIQAWFAQASRRPARTAAHMEALLEDYGLRRREATGEATLHLPSATVSTTHHQPAAEVVDDELAAAWADALPEHVLASMLGDDAGLDPMELRAKLVKRTTKVYAAALRKLVRVDGDKVVGLDGEPVPGTQVRPESTTAKATPL